MVLLAPAVGLVPSRGDVAFAQYVRGYDSIFAMLLKERVKSAVPCRGLQRPQSRELRTPRADCFLGHIAGSAGAIRTTANRERQIQFALGLEF